MFSQSKLSQHGDSKRQLYFQKGKYPKHEIGITVPNSKPIAQSSTSIWEKLVSVLQRFILHLTHGSKLSIQKMASARQNSLWYVRDPHTGKSFYAETFNEVIDWIEAHHSGY